MSSAERHEALADDVDRMRIGTDRVPLDEVPALTADDYRGRWSVPPDLAEWPEEWRDAWVQAGKGGGAHG